MAVDLAVDRLRVRIEQQLGRVAPVPLGEVVRAVHAIAVALAGLDAGDVAVPDVTVDLGQRHPGLGTGIVDQAQLHRRGDLGEEREVHPGPP